MLRHPGTDNSPQSSRTEKSARIVPACYIYLLREAAGLPVPAGLGFKTGDYR